MGKDGMRIRKVQKIIENVQYNRATHEKYLKMLQDNYHQSDKQEFAKSFMFILSSIFIKDTKVKNPFVSRTLEFLAKFTISLADEEGNNVFLAKIIKEILQYHNSASHHVRFHVCEFIKLLLNSLGDSGDIDDDICDDICAIMQERINDLKSSVRLQAVYALQRLQDPHDKEDSVIKTYLKCLSIEFNSQIRRTLVQCIGPSMVTIPLLMQRCLDKDDSVRLAAFEKFSKIPVRFMKLEQRQFILRNGFRSKNSTILTFMTDNLLPRWLAYYNGIVFDFLKALRLDANEDEIKNTVELLENVMNAFFKMKTVKDMLTVLSVNDEKLVPLNELTFETSLYWRKLIHYIQDQREEAGEECYDQVIPDLVNFVKYVETYYKTIKQPKTEWEYLMRNQILSELLKILTIYDLLDETGRKETHNLITNILTDAFVSYDNVLLMMGILEKIIPSVDERSTEICFIISNIREPVVQNVPTNEHIKKRDLKVAPLKVQINLKTEDLETAVSKQEYQKAEQLKNEIAQYRKQMDAIYEEYENMTSTVRVTKNDTQTMLKCLDLLIALLQSSQFKELTGALRTIMEQFLKPLLLLSDPSMQPRALECFAIFCCIDKKEALTAVQYISSQVLSYRYSSPYCPALVRVSTEAIVDLLLIYGKTIFGPDETGEILDITKKKSGMRSLYDDTQMEETIPSFPEKPTFSDIIGVLSDMLDDADAELREIAGIALVKLLSSTLVRSPQLVSKLILKWFNPATAKDVRLRQVLGLFFPEYIMKVPGSLEIVEQAFIPTLNAIVNAPKNSPLVDVDVDAMLKFLAELSRPYRNRFDKGLDVHKNLSLQLCNEICNKPNNKCVPVYLRTLLLLDQPEDDEIMMESLKKQASVMLELLTEKPHIKLVQKYMDRLNGMEQAITAQNTIDQTDTMERVSEVNGNVNGRESAPQFNGKRKRSCSSSSSSNRSMIGKPKQSTLGSILERSTENDSIANDDLTIQNSSTENNFPLAPEDFARLAVSGSDTASELEQPEEPVRRRSLRKSARRT